MPTYEFEDENGKRVEVFLQMGQAPAWGEYCEIDGQRLKRVVETPVDPYVPDFTCITRINGFWDPSYPRFDAMGRGVINSKREHDELKAKSEGRIVWD